MELSSFWDSVSGFLLTLPPGLLEVWGQLVLFAVPLCLYFAAAALPFVVLYGLIRAHFGRRSLLERCARQQARLGNFLNWLFVVCAAGLWLAKVVLFTEWHPLHQMVLYVCAGLLLGGTLLWTLVVAAWKKLRKWPVLHGFLAFFAGSCLATLPAVGLLFGRILMQGTVLPQEYTLVVLAEMLIPPVSDPFWLIFGIVHLIEIASAGALGLFWLLIRRKADDFGRDYYVFAANWCGGWAAWGGWLTLLCGGGLCAMLRWQGLLSFENRNVLLLVAVPFFALFFASILWTIIARSALPMRHKIGMVFALLLLFLVIANCGMLLLV